MRRFALLIGLLPTVVFAGTTRYVPGNPPHLLTSTTAAVETCNTASIFDVYRVTIPANTMGPTGILRVRIFGDFLQNDAAAPTFTWTVTFGATTVYAMATSGLGADVDRGVLWVDIELANTGVANGQIMSGMVVMGARGTPTTGIGSLQAPTTMVSSGGYIGGSAAEDTSGPQDIAVSMTMSAAAATACVRLQQASVELL